ncbi:GtrA family protein [Altererythrobacter sp. MTPC7]|uniref:GtrA family protein n=1 Tax=Altererythrobacter sp. MTPC7 TaxID=3056567 RepID=UPI0036F3A1DA
MKSLLESNHVVPQTLRYGAVGLIVLAADIAVYAGSLLVLPGAWLPANIAGKAAGAATGFVLHRNVTFRGASAGSRTRQGAGYVALLGFNMALSSALLWALVEQAGLDAFAAKLVTEVAVISTAFLLSRTLVFRAD